MAEPPPLQILLAGPRGFCAGVDRAVQIVERALEKYGPPIYVRHEIVHNRFVVESLEAKGAIFIQELDQAPDDRPVIVSAHGVPKSVPAEAARRGLTYLDATCPLVSKVHVGIEKYWAAGRSVLLIGHKGHPEVVGAMGQLPDGAVILVEDEAQAEAVTVPEPDKIAYVTQTTLSVDETAAIIAVLRRRFPALDGPAKDDLCYATTNRQAAVKAIAPRCDAVLVIGAPNSSNSRQLRSVAEKAGCPRAVLARRADELDWPRFLQGVATLGVTAGASAPEVLVEEVIDAARRHRAVEVEELRVASERVRFRLPKLLESEI